MNDIEAAKTKNKEDVANFSDGGKEWRCLPAWAEFLIQLGFRWHESQKGRRRIAIVSMPCDSAAAGLIGLGALIHDLGNPNANNVDGHYDALLRYARQYLESCRDCKTRCDPQLAGCGYAAEATGMVGDYSQRGKSAKRKKRLYTISDQTDFQNRRLALSREGTGNAGPITWWPAPQYATGLQINGEPLPETKDVAGALPDDVYLQIVADAPIIRDNLRRSFSGLCLAGRVTGETATREVCAGIRFRGSRGEYDLPNLLTVYGWLPSNIVSRIVFFNARTEQFDRRAETPSLVVADGDASLLKVLSNAAFQCSDVIGVIHRAIERDRLEAIGSRMSGLQQWYAVDTEMVGRLPSTPRGMSISILKKRSQ